MPNYDVDRFCLDTKFKFTFSILKTHFGPINEFLGCQSSRPCTLYLSTLLQLPFRVRNLRPKTPQSRLKVLGH